MRHKIALCALFFALVLVPRSAQALGECGMACCLLNGAEGMTQADALTVSLKYEYMFMKTLKSGADEVSTDEVIKQNLGAKTGAKYMTSDEMVMQKYNLLVSYPVTEKLILMGHIPYLVNDMEMVGGSRMENGMIMTMNNTMDTISGLGDISLFALYTVMEDAPVRPNRKMTIGAGIKAPTGDYEATKADGKLVHAMMQAGSGSWDPIIMVSYFQRFDPWSMGVNALYQFTTKGEGGYEFGDQFAFDVTGAYNYEYLNFKLSLNTIIAGQDTDHDGRYSNPMMSMIDNPDNTGLTSISLTPAIQYKIPDTMGNVELLYQAPIYQDVEGTQQVMDWRLFATIVWSF